MQIDTLPHSSAAAGVGLGGYWNFPPTLTYCLVTVTVDDLHLATHSTSAILHTFASICHSRTTQYHRSHPDALCYITEIDHWVTLETESATSPAKFFSSTEPLSRFHDHSRSSIDSRRRRRLAEMSLCPDLFECHWLSVNAPTSLKVIHIRPL